MRKILLRLLLVFVFTAARSDTASAYYNDIETVQGNQLSTACWSLPAAPILTSPADNATTTNSSVTFNWTGGSSNCPTAMLSSHFEIFSDPEVNTLYTQSGWGSFTSFVTTLSDSGDYWWRVQTRDQYGNLTSSGARKLIISLGPAETPSLKLRVEDKLIDELALTSSVVSGAVAFMFSDTIDDVYEVGSLTVTPPAGGLMTRLGRPQYSSDDGKYVWESRLIETFSAGAKTLALDYNFFTRDSGPFDDPGFLIRLNGQEIFASSSAALNPQGDDFAHYSDWQRFFYDLSGYQDADNLNLAIYAGNTGDTSKQSWAYVANITTDVVVASSSAKYQVTGETSGGPADCSYYMDSGSWLSADLFNIYPSGDRQLSYRCVGIGGGEKSDNVRVITDSATPSAVIDLEVVSTTGNSVILSWHAPGNDGNLGRASKYDVRYSASEITAANFDSAIKVVGIPAPKPVGATEILEVLGLNPQTSYYFAVKSLDEAVNVSPISNIVSQTTPPGTAINAGDIIINELMWTGSSVSQADEYLELRNMTNRTISLAGLSFTKFNGSDDEPMDIDLTGKSIAPYGYFLIANGNSYAGGDSQLKNSPNLWDSSLDLDGDNLRIKLFAGSDLIDEAWNESEATEGLIGEDEYYSMERVSVPGDGSNPLSWYTCIDAGSTDEFFDGGADERGTPGAVNRSVNEPLAHQKLIPRPTLVLSEDKKNLDITLDNISGYTKVSYELTYETDSTPEGVIGKADLGVGAQKFEKTILLGTCSSGGACVYHAGAKNFKVKFTLIKSDGAAQIIEKSL